MCSLLSSCGLLFMPNARVISPRSDRHKRMIKPAQPPSTFVSLQALSSYIFRAASDDELSRFHSREYVAALRRYGSHGGQDDDAEDDVGSLDDDDEIFEFGLGKCYSGIVKKT